MTTLVLLLLSLLVSPNHPDCQHLCLGTCRWSPAQNRCLDSRVAYLGTWDPLPLDYEPPTESQFPVWKLAYPQEWGSYPLEQPRPESEGESP